MWVYLVWEISLVRFQIRYDPMLDESGRATRWFGAATEIEDRKQAEDELRRSEESLHEAQKLSRTGSWMSCQVDS